MNSIATPHNHASNFGRRVVGCPRCAELTAGAKPVEGWGAQKKRQDAMRCEAIRAHFAPGGRGSQIAAAGGIDTAFEW